jgi:glycosyltransferase involved in cell wall biosynthesis
MSAELAKRVGNGAFVLFLGRIEWKKGLDRLIDALVLTPQTRLVIAGNDEHGFERVLEARAIAKGVESRLRFVGPVFGADKNALLAAAKVLALTSYSENFGNVVLEALASGSPVLLTPEVGLAPAVVNADVGEVVEGDAAAIASALDRLMRDDAHTDAMRARRRAFAATYTWPAVAARMEMLYRKVSG